MSNITLRIGGRDYVVACAPGEEAHVARLGQLIDGKLADMPGGGALGETRSLLFAALLLADQVHDLEQARPAPAPEPAGVPVEKLAALAERIEAIAGRIEAGVEKRRRRA